MLEYVLRPTQHAESSLTAARLGTELKHMIKSPVLNTTSPEGAAKACPVGQTRGQLRVKCADL